MPIIILGVMPVIILGVMPVYYSGVMPPYDFGCYANFMLLGVMPFLWVCYSLAGLYL